MKNERIHLSMDNYYLKVPLIKCQLEYNMQICQVQEDPSMINVQGQSSQKGKELLPKMRQLKVIQTLAKLIQNERCSKIFFKKIYYH